MWNIIVMFRIQIIKFFYNAMVDNKIMGGKDSNKDEVNSPKNNQTSLKRNDEIL